MAGETKTTLDPGVTLHDQANRPYTFVKLLADGSLMVRDNKTGSVSRRESDGKIKNDPGSDRALVLGSRPLRNYEDTGTGRANSKSKSTTTRSFEHDGAQISITINIGGH